MILSFLCVLILLALIKAFHKLWWMPTRIQNLMVLQGIKGPSYRFLYGNAKEIISMQNEAMSRPMKLSHDISSHVQPHIHAWSKSYGRNFLQWYGPQPVLVVTEPELCKEILLNKDGVYPKPKASKLVKKLVGDSISVTEGEKWEKLRKLSNHAFRGERVKNMFADMKASAETMVERWKGHEGKEIDVVEEFRLYTSEVISRTAFGSSYLEGKNLFEKLSKLIVFRTSDDIESDKLDKGIRDSIMDIVKKREEEAIIGEEDSFGSDFLGLLLKAHHGTNDKQRISVDELVEECRTFYFAGQETTCLAPKPVGVQTMSIINETLRLYPPAVMLIRKVAREVRLGKIIVPADIELLVPTLALHHDPQLWGQDATLFKPKRFSEGVAKATNDNMAAFMPFGLGPRICVGFNFATIEAKIALSMILQRYSFTLSPAYVHSPSQYLTVCPQHGVQLSLRSL
ncbi:putative cytochrome P450 [Rosa chinensis]|uniref:Putative cytochrome P450 n=1 Tax=Rosa chinensis TaxID=74649 RepID=A0A2P6R2C3_ROSCH|nr:putative cytochrome P450 [Rosa chinensis]